MAIQEVRTFVELYTFVLKRLKLPTDVTDISNRVRQAINIAYSTIMQLESWPFAQREAKLTTLAKYDTGTVAVTIDTTTWTFSTAYGSNLEAGMKIGITGSDPTIYEISTLPSGTTITTDTDYRGSTVTAANFRAYKDRYSLATDFGEPIDVLEFFNDRAIRPLAWNEMRRRLSLDPTPGKPAHFALDFQDATAADPVPKILLYPPPDKKMILPYGYKIDVTLLDADGDEPIFPDKWRVLICWWAMADLYRDIKDDGRAQSASAQAAGMLTKMSGTYFPTKGRPRFWPDKSRYFGKVKRLSPRTLANRFHLGQDLFGRLP